jgi:O-antigen biosynthesis protein
MWRRRARANDRNRAAAGAGCDPAALIKTADRLRDAGRPSAAAQAYNTVLAVAPWLTGIRVQYGNMLKDCGRLPEAEAAYRQALSESPDDPDIHLQLGHVLKLMGRRPASLAAYRSAAGLDPLSAPALRELQAAGDRSALDAAFRAQLLSGGVEALLSMTAEVADLRLRLDRLSIALPDIRAAVGFPVEHYDRFRAIFDLPAPNHAFDVGLFLIVVAAERAPLATLYEQLRGLRAQSYPNWRAIVFGCDPDYRHAVERAAVADPRFCWAETDPAETEIETEIRLVRGHEGEWLLLSGGGAILHKHALGWVAFARHLSCAAAFFFDSEMVEATGDRWTRSAPVLRQVADYDSLLEANTCGETITIERTAFLEEAERLCTATTSAGRHSLLLELCRKGRLGHIPFPLTWFINDPTAGSDPCRFAAVTRHLRQNDLVDRVEIERGSTDGLRIRWIPRTPEAEIAVIIPTRDNVHDLLEFADSLFATAVKPERISIIVLDNGSGAPARRVLERAQNRALEVMRVDEPFNWSRLNNIGAARAKAPLLVFANDDMRMLTRAWDQTLRGLLERPEIGAVGARLLYPDESIQHAGVLLGWQGAAIHDGVGEPATAPGPNRRWHSTRAAGAVTGAFLATRRQTFAETGGFDEAELPVSFSDIDYALRVRAAGLIVLWTPAISLYHYESKTRGLDHTDSAKHARYSAELHVMQQRWGEAFIRDPSVNPLWLDVTMPFRLIAAPATERVNDHIRQCAAADPWRVSHASRPREPVGDDPAYDRPYSGMAGRGRQPAISRAQDDGSA